MWQGSWAGTASSRGYTTLLVFKRFFSVFDIFVAVSAVIRAAPIVGAAF